MISKKLYLIGLIGLVITIILILWKYLGVFEYRDALIKQEKSWIKNEFLPKPISGIIVDITEIDKNGKALKIEEDKEYFVLSLRIDSENNSGWNFEIGDSIYKQPQKMKMRLVKANGECIEEEIILF